MFEPIREVLFDNGVISVQLLSLEQRPPGMGSPLQLVPDRTALIVVDVQRHFTEAPPFVAMRNIIPPHLTPSTICSRDRDDRYSPQVRVQTGYGRCWKTRIKNAADDGWSSLKWRRSEPPCSRQPISRDCGRTRSTSVRCGRDEDSFQRLLGNESP
jgi:hypothetical protein